MFVFPLNELAPQETNELIKTVSVDMMRLVGINFLLNQYQTFVSSDHNKNNKTDYINTTIFVSAVLLTAGMFEMFISKYRR